MKYYFLTLIVAIICAVVYADREASRQLHTPTQEQIQHIADSVRTEVNMEQLQEYKAEFESLDPN